MPILQTEMLTRRFGKMTAVDGLSFSVEPCEVFGLVGPNGAGKTTTIKMLTTLLPPSSGRAQVAGFDIVRQAGQVRRLIGYVPQMLSADGSLTGYENLIVFAKLYDIPRRECETRVRQSLEFMGLADAADKQVREYSGGMIQRLEIAQSMLHQPRVLFLDEPTIGLDPLARKTVWEHIVSHINPLTYEVDALRALMLAGGTSTYGIELDMGTLVAALVILVIIGGRLYPRVAT